MAPKTPTRPRDTAARILDVAEGLVQVRGFNAFSYADVAAELGITKASLHYHYPGKGELGVALLERYTTRFTASLEEIDGRTTDPVEKLRAYAGLYLEVLRGQRMCLCGMLAAEYQTLPEPMQAAVLSFFDANEAWLGRVLEEGRAGGSLRFDRPPAETARLVVGSLQGALLLARPRADLDGFRDAAELLLATLA
ncbi:MAG TPA: TetR/AcrR family transcriptional regulator [Gaiellaceae bacterium]|jgi:TetR/AcrR family transcriptional repressor of nem operon|nr:TetR/AcrR family transcriptional regulator [Gaiellaceae bacterium]